MKNNQVQWLANFLYQTHVQPRKHYGPYHKGIAYLDKHQFQDDIKYWLAVADIVESRKIQMNDARRIVESAILDYNKWYPKESARNILDMVYQGKECSPDVVVN